MHGIGVCGPMRKEKGKWETPRERYARNLESRKEFLSDHVIECFLLSLAVLAPIQPTKPIRLGASSYRLKHISENYVCTYPEGHELGPQCVSSGALIAAAIHAGFKYKTYVCVNVYDLLNVNFNMPKALIKNLDFYTRPDRAWAQDRRRRAEMQKNKALNYYHV